MRIKILIFGSLREKLGWREKSVELDRDRARIIDIIKLIPELAEQIIEKDMFKNEYIVLLNGHNIKLLQNEYTPIKNNDKIIIFPPGGGG